MGGSEEIKLVQSSTLAEVGEAIASLKAQASKGMLDGHVSLGLERASLSSRC